MIVLTLRNAASKQTNKHTNEIKDFNHKIKYPFRTAFNVFVYVTETESLPLLARERERERLFLYFMEFQIINNKNVVLGFRGGCGLFESMALLHDS